MRDVLLIGATDRDLVAVRDAGLDALYRTHVVGRDPDGPEAFAPAALVAEAERRPADGVVATKDRSALLAAVVAQRRRLPGPTPRAVLSCQHKLTSRLIQQEVVPAAVPRFAAVDGHPVPLPLPFFVKPVVGRLSEGAFRVDTEEQVPRPREDEYRRSYATLARLAGVDGLDFRGHLAEELVTGREVTLEGYVHGGRVVLIGATDSVCYPGTGSFQRFEHPSALPAGRLEELGAVAERVLPAAGFDEGFFNAEFVVPEHGPAVLLEVNPRLASQFAPLVLATRGRSTYDALYTLACGDDPAWGEPAPDGVAVSWVLRVFTDARVEAVPDAEPGVEVLVRPGALLSEQGANDARSYRLAIVVEHAGTRAEAVRRGEERAEALRRLFRLAAV